MASAPGGGHHEDTRVAAVAFDPWKNKRGSGSITLLLEESIKTDDRFYPYIPRRMAEIDGLLLAAFETVRNAVRSICIENWYMPDRDNCAFDRRSLYLAVYHCCRRTMFQPSPADV